MKTIKKMITRSIVFMALGSGLTLSCQQESAPVTGTYINHATSEFSIADDTLIVEHVKDLDYLIHRKTGYFLLDDSGRPGKQALEKEAWKAVYDQRSGTMTENSKGRVISFDGDKGVLKLESSVFQRIN